jgi:hypothetical protein
MPIPRNRRAAVRAFEDLWSIPRLSYWLAGSMILARGVGGRRFQPFFHTCWQARRAWITRLGLRSL